MKKENEQKLFKRFPTIFPKGRDVNPRRSLMNYGISVSDGWYDLIWKLCEDIEKKSKKVYAVQVKEKFGQLRFYLEGEVTRGILNLEIEAEQKSYSICEQCGKEGKLRMDLCWKRTLCDECYNQVIRNIKSKIANVKIREL